MTRRQARKIVKRFLQDQRYHPLERVQRALRVYESIAGQMMLYVVQDGVQMRRRMTQSADRFYLTSCSKIDLDAFRYNHLMAISPRPWHKVPVPC